jgi:hypothetical protein
MYPVRWWKETVALETYCSVSKRTENILIKVGVISRKVGDLEECEVYLKLWGLWTKKMDLSKRPYLESYMGVYQNGAVY